MSGGATFLFSKVSFALDITSDVKNKSWIHETSFQ